ncbi:MAG: hypothetical protein OXC93_11725 [Rhodospirillaceae bacterium]|nr:hypothetical protein [Rhodospirillaceae bacterium]
MTRKPAVVTAGWQEVSDSLARTGIFKENQLNPETVPRILGDFVRRYTTIIGYGIDGELNPIGSGTFLRKTDGQHGILTAGHVIGAIKTKENILVLANQDREEVTWIGIEGAGMEGHGEANDGPRGPDIGWMPLSGEEVERLEALGAVFSNRAREREAFLGQVCQISIVFGFVEEASDLHNKLVVAHGMLIGKTGELDADEEGWDYSEYAITNDDPWIPRTHGGVSGSAIWRIDLPMDCTGRKAVILEGVVFAEGPEDDRKLIAHGKNSVRIILDER